MGKGMSQRHLGTTGRAGRVGPPDYWDSQVTLSSDPLKYAEIQGVGCRVLGFFCLLSRSRRPWLLPSLGLGFSA